MKSKKDLESRFNYCVEHQKKEFYPNGLWYLDYP